MKTAEKIKDTVKTFTDLQNEILKGFFGDFSSPVKNPFENLANPSEIYENTVKFHTACIQYHNSVLNILETMNALNPIKTNK